jgi:5-methylcytosine-specific restriction endonuclease McrA
MSGWFHLRFEPDDRKMHRACETCGRGLWLPKSKHGLYKTCGGACAETRYRVGAELRAAEKPAKPKRVLLGNELARRAAATCEQCGTTINPRKLRDLDRRYCSRACVKAYGAGLLAFRTRACQQCGASFVAKKSQLDAGVGLFCSQRCNYAAGSWRLLTETVKAKALANRLASVAVNGTKHKTGPENPSWKGGREASKARSRPRQAEALRKYRKANPDKVREFRQNRNGKKLGRLPRGTIPKLHKLQRGMCAICRCKLDKSYHVDHIQPIARGGAHAPDNVQLLCPPCNVRKGAKDPIRYMQERGFLL